MFPNSSGSVKMENFDPVHYLLENHAGASWVFYVSFFTCFFVISLTRPDFFVSHHVSQPAYARIFQGGYRQAERFPTRRGRTGADSQPHATTPLNLCLTTPCFSHVFPPADIKNSWRACTGCESVSIRTRTLRRIS